MLRIVLDTNVLIASISQKSPYHWVWKAFVEGKYELCISTEILDEYAEIIERFYSVADAENTLAHIMLSPNTVQIIRYYEWNAIIQDPDDNRSMHPQIPLIVLLPQMRTTLSQKTNTSIF